MQEFRMVLTVTNNTGEYLSEADAYGVITAALDATLLLHGIKVEVVDNEEVV